MSLIFYLVQVTCCLAFFYGFYHLALRKETLFETNRYYLVITLASSIVLPLIKIYVDTQSADSTSGIAPYVYVGAYADALSTDFDGAKSKPFPWDRLITGIYFLGVAVMAIRLLNAVKEIYWIRRSGVKTMVDGQVCILSDQVKSPFSFFNTIYFPKRHQFGETEFKEIVAHELAHVRGRHTVDVLFMETACILLWPSPLIYFYRKALKDVHEFVADAAVIRDTPWESYAQLLVSQQQGQLQNILSNQLIYSQLKKRLLMMNSKRSGTMAGLKYLGFIPVLLIVLVLFSFREKSSTEPGLNRVANEAASDRIIHLSIAADRKIYFNLTEIPRDELESFLRNQISLTKDTLLYVRIDKSLKVDAMAEIDEIGQKVKIHTVFETDNSLNLYRDGLPVSTELDKPWYYIPRSNEFGIIESDRAQPVFPGCTNIPIPEQEQCGMTKLGQYVQDNMIYPESVKQAGIQGRVVVKFTIGADGWVKDINVVESLHPDADQVVVKLVADMNGKAGKWLPATKEGKAHDAVIHLPVKFSLDNPADKESPLQYAEELPRFPGCEDIQDATERSACATRKLYEFIYTHIQYPKEDRDNKIEGHCIVQFVIDADGSLSDINVLRSPSETMKAEVNRLMTMMAALPEKWTPARNEGKAVAMQFTLPIKFKLEEKVIQVDSPELNSVENKETGKTVSILPNPATESITVDLIEGTHTIHIFDLSGKLVLTHKVAAESDNKEAINISALPAGRYAVKLITPIESASGSFTIQK